MEPDQKLESIVKNLKNALSKKLEDWNNLKEDLKKRKLVNYEEYIKEVSADEAGKTLAVFKKLEERFGYGRMYSDEGRTGGSPAQFKRVMDLSRTEGNVCAMLDSIAEAGYTLNEYKEGWTTIRYVTEKDIAFFKKLLKDDMYKKAYETFKILKRTMGYKEASCPSNRHTEIENLIAITEMKGDALGAICLLSNEGYETDKKTGLTKDHVETIKEIIKNVLQETDSTLYLYRKLKPGLFKEYFSSISQENKKTAVEKILGSEYQNEEIIRWLDEAYPDIVREAGFNPKA